MNSEAINISQKLDAFENSSDIDQVVPNMTSDEKASSERLSELLVGDQSPAIFSTGIPVSSGGETKINTLGDAILRRLDTLGSTFRQKSDKVAELLNTEPGSYSLQKMLQLQMQVSMVSVEIEIVGKGVQKVVQHADQLTKLQ